MAEKREQEQPEPRSSKYEIHMDHPTGVAIGDHARVEIHGSGRPAGPPAPPGIDVELLTSVVPTAYCRNTSVETYHLLTVVLDNTGRGCGSAVLRVSATIEGYSEPATVTQDLSQGQLVRIPLLPVLVQDAVAALTEIRQATVRVEVRQLRPEERALYDQRQPIRLHAYDTALLALRAPDGSMVDLSDHLAAWVTPRHPRIERLLRQAAERHPKRRFTGYAGASTLAQSAATVRAQARAIYEALKHDAGLVYVHSALHAGMQEGQVTQRVRLPAESLAAGGSANCIDGTVLYASLLELAQIEPVIAIVPGHAFLGWRTWPAAAQYEFVETTMIGTHSFGEAQAAGKARYDKAVAEGWMSHGFHDPGGYARLIDVAACRARGIDPLL